MMYQFNEEDVYRFAREKFIKTRNKGAEIQFEICPFCHGGKHRDKWTFSFNRNSGACNCRRSTCGFSGNMVTVAQATDFFLTEDVTRYYNVNNYNGKFKSFKEEHRKEATPIAIEYLESRGIPRAITERYGITSKKDSEEIIVFPFRNEHGELKFIKYRNINFQKGDSGSKEWCESNCMPILFGMDQVNFENKTLIITEGQIDSLSVTAAGFENAVSVPTGKNGFTWIGHCWDFVCRFNKIIIFGDKEDKNITLVDDLRKRFGSRDDLTISVVRIEDYLDCKDANEILQKYGTTKIIECINKAQPIPIPNIKLLADVERENPFEKEKLATGFRTIDRNLYGGLAFGGYVLITGKAGEGKSTLANQIICQALNQGYNTFVYSGELTNSFFKNSIDRQLAGRHVLKYQDELWHDDRFTIPDDVQNKISEWYRNRCFVYSDEISDDPDSIISLMERAINQYGVRVFLIDNLMTALDLEQSESKERFDQQSEFVRKIARLARKMNVLIILVAHKRKGKTVKADNDDILGTSEIANLATVIISFARKEEGANQNKLDISKERLFGKTMSDLTIFYDPQSKRLYENVEDLNFEYSWYGETDNDGFLETDETDEIPF